MLLYLEYPSWIQPEIIPGFFLRWYGLMYLVAIGITYALFRYQVRKNKIDFSSDDTLTLLIYMMISALLVARIFATTVYDTSGKFLRQPWLIFWPFDNQGNFTGFQGMSYFGGLVGTVIGALLYSWRYKQNMLLLGDLLVHGFPLGYMFGRLGNFINGELYGRITSSPVGMIFPLARRVSTRDPLVQRVMSELGVSGDPLMVNLPRHASQLYEAFGEGLFLWVVLWFIVRPRRPYDGFSIAVYIMAYGIIRFVIEFYRELDPGFTYYTPLNLSLGQLFCLAAVAGGAVMLLILHTRHKNQPKIETFHHSEKL